MFSRRRYSNQSDPLTKSTNRSEEATEDESSDYAYIDRSTHSITGYLNNESKQTAAAVGTDRNGVIPHDLVMHQESDLNRVFECSIFLVKFDACNFTSRH